jgi:hypothetical protein
VTALEDEILYLAELWHLGYEDMMRLPYSRRKRLVEKKDELERKRVAREESEARRARSRR